MDGKIGDEVDGMGCWKEVGREGDGGFERCCSRDEGKGEGFFAQL